MYCQIIFAQENEVYDEVYERLYDGGLVCIENIEDAIDYLAQWDYGVENEYDDAIVEDLDRCIGDDVYESEDGEYVLVFRSGLYAALYRKL